MAKPNKENRKIKGKNRGGRKMKSSTNRKENVNNNKEVIEKKLIGG